MTKNPITVRQLLEELKHYSPSDVVKAEAGGINVYAILQPGSVLCIEGTIITDGEAI